MPTPPHEASIALTYAWWLTGDDESAEAAVVEAVRLLPVRVEGTEQLPVLLRRVRDVAAPARTMCPASELALLHDGHAIDLEHAAALVDVAESDARTELAHGRLEALVQTVLRPFAHPERLGGLAVGNPPDVAHARTCTSCATALELIREGREELCALPAINAPAALLARLRQVEPHADDGSHGDAAGEDGQAAQATPAPSPVAAPFRNEATEATEAPEPDAAAPVPLPDPLPESVLDAANPTDARHEDGPAGSASPSATSASGTDTQAQAGTEGATPAGAAGGGAAGDATTSAPGAALQRSRRPTVGIAAVIVGMLIVLLTAVLTTPSEPGEPADPADPAGVRDQSAAAPGSIPTEDGGPVAASPGSAADEQPGTEAPATGGLGAGAPATDDPRTDGIVAPATDDTEPTGAATSIPLDGFTVTDAGVLPPGATAPVTGAPDISPGDALRVAVRYAGGAEGVILTAVPDIPGEVAAALDVALTGDAGSHLFIWLAPSQGWPTGRWQVQLLADDGLAGVVDVTVI
jgi:hypothetical protein